MYVSFLKMFLIINQNVIIGCSDEKLFSGDVSSPIIEPA